MNTQSIKSRIKNIITKHPNMDISLSVGLAGVVLKYTSKKDFGNRVLSSLEDNSVSDIVFKGIENNTLIFQTIYKLSDSFKNRGYGQGRYMGD